MSRDQRRLAGEPTRSWRRRNLAAFVASLGALAIVLPTLSSGGGTAAGTPVASSVANAAASRVDLPAPLLYHRSFADPSVVQSMVGLVGAATAPNLNIARAPADVGPWNVIGTPALTHRPSWATSREIWAPDIQRVRGGWVMYFAAGITGADPNSRCIGVATARTAFGPYTPFGSRPLVCPVVPGVPRAADAPPMRVMGKRSSTRGVIDPSSFKGNRGQRYLVYRTQGQPSSIRLVKLTRGGKGIQKNKTSMFLTRHRGIEENPVIIKRANKWLMFTSVGWFGHCGYRTYWRRSKDFRDWSRATPRLLLSTANGLCGPGGADLLPRKDGVTQIYFHAWTCYREPYPCPPDWNKDRPQKRKGVRALYGATLGWTAFHRPYIESWIAGVLPPLPPPTPTPTPTPTETPTGTPTETPTGTPTETPTETSTGAPTETSTVTDTPSTPTDSPSE